MAIQGLLDTMASGLAAHNKLFSGAALPRVASEGVMVAIATEGALGAPHHRETRPTPRSKQKWRQGRRDLRITGGNDP